MARATAGDAMPREKFYTPNSFSVANKQTAVRYPLVRGLNTPSVSATPGHRAVEQAEARQNTVANFLRRPIEFIGLQ